MHLLFQQAEQLYNTMVKRFNFNKDVWISYGYFLMKSGRHGAAHKLMQRSFKSLTQKERKFHCTHQTQVQLKRFMFWTVLLLIYISVGE